MKRMSLPRGLGGNVFAFGLVSFFTDVSSEMIYPLLPLFLTTVLGAGPAALGLIEGIAESTAALLKLVSGQLSDRLRSRTVLVLGGYALSAFARPFIAVATSVSTVLAVRFTDRVGKGIRTSPRDAMIADAVEPSLRGRAFGFQRSMDHAGAVVGPLLAAALLSGPVPELRALFWWAAVPGIIAVLLIPLGVREEAPHRREASQQMLAAVPAGPLRRYLLILFVFTLANSSDAFLLLRASQLGVPRAGLPLIWVALHVVKMLSTLPGGMLSDRIGRRRVILLGWSVFAATYAGFAAATTAWHAWALFAFYGLFYGLTEGVERALMVDLAPVARRGGILGWYHFVIGLGALPASLLFGLIWKTYGSSAAFLLSAGLGLLAAVLLTGLVRLPGREARHRHV